MCIDMTAVFFLTYQTISLTWYNMVNNQTPCIIVKVIVDYDYIYNVIDYDYIASGNGDYDYLISCNRLLITITPTLPIMCVHWVEVIETQYFC